LIVLDKKTNELLDKIAQQDATGMSQYKQRKVESERGHSGEGTGLGALIGAGAGALSPKYKSLAAMAGGALGALAGRELGKRTKTRSRTTTLEGVIKKQQKNKAPTATPYVPRIEDSKVLRLLQR